MRGLRRRYRRWKLERRVDAHAREARKFVELLRKTNPTAAGVLFQRILAVSDRPGIAVEDLMEEVTELCRVAEREEVARLERRLDGFERS